MTSTSIDKIANGEKPANPVAKFSGFLDRYKPQMALALPKHLNVDRMARLAVTAFSQNDTLQKCTNDSIVGCVLTASQLGLEIGVNGQAYMIPYYDNRARVHRATFVPGWKGLIDLVNRAGRASAWTGAVHDGDEFDYSLGDRPFVRHKPGDHADERELLYVYAIGRVRGSDWPNIEVWPMSKVWKHRDKYNKVGERHYSFAHPEMYARKIVLLQVLKYLPQSVELTRAVEFAAAADSGEGMTIDADFASSTLDVDPSTGEIAPPPPPPKPNGNGGAPTKTCAQYAEAIRSATGAEPAALELDEARTALPADEYDELCAVYRARWDPKSA